MHHAREFVLIVMCVWLVQGRSINPNSIYNAPPLKSLYGNAVGALKLPVFLNPSQDNVLGVENPPQSHQMNDYMSETTFRNAMSSTTHQIETPLVQQQEMSAEQQAALESKIENLQNQISNFDESQQKTMQSSAFQGLLVPSVVHMSFKIPSRVFVNSTISQKIAQVIADICNVELENVRLERVDDSGLMELLVFPSLDFEYEGDANVIAHQLLVTFQNSQFITRLDKAMIEIKLKEFTVETFPELIDLEHFVSKFDVNILCTTEPMCAQSHITIVSQAVSEALQTGEQNVLVVPVGVSDTSSVAARVLVHSMNSSRSPISAESQSHTFLTMCNNGNISRIIQNVLREQYADLSVVKLVCSGEYSVSPIVRELPTNNLGMDSTCFGHGKLLENGTCDCDSRWKGVDCSLRRCPHGYTSHLTTLPFLECSGQGYCNDPWGVCMCDEGYGGDDCSKVTQCSPSDTIQCSSHGSCTPEDSFPHKVYTCKCLKGWAGDQCERRIGNVCPKGIGRIDSQWGYATCSSRGQCACDEIECKCECVSGWTGPACNIKACPDSCNDHGLCFDGECLCQNGWAGPACNIQSLCVNGCSNRGTCQNDGSCSCRTFFEGSACQINACESDETSRTRRVVTVHTNVMDQNSGITWKIDSESVQGPFQPETLSHHTMCLSVGVHTLTVQHSGSSSVVSDVITLSYDITKSQNITADQNIRLINIGGGVYEFNIYGQCSGTPTCNRHGSCTQGECCCAVGWSGHVCDVRVPIANVTRNCTHCGPHMTCTSQNPTQCVCTRELELSGLCSKESCPYHPEMCGVCSGHGVCHDGLCHCDVSRVGNLTSGWFGIDCSTPIRCPDACNVQKGQGSCDLNSGRCACNSGFSGISCEIPTCAGDVPCNGQGICTASGRCECNPQYTGDACQFKTCLGGCVSGICNGQTGKCDCVENWSGVHCEVPAQCPQNMIFSNCTFPEPLTCDSYPSFVQKSNCVPGCTCPDSHPLWDPKKHVCVTNTHCSTSCWSDLSPSPAEIAFHITPQRTMFENESVVHVCAYHKFHLCYKSGTALLNSTDPRGLIAHARDYHSPIGFVVYDSHGNRVTDTWGKSLIESDGHVTGLFNAEGGFASMSVSKFGPMEIRMYVIGPSSSAPIFIASQRIFASDCDTQTNQIDQVVEPAKCSLPAQFNNGTFECTGTAEGSTCHFECDERFVLSHPKHDHVTCLGTSLWDRDLPRCIDMETAQHCDTSRIGQICLPMISSAPTRGICVKSNNPSVVGGAECESRTISKFCARAPVDVGVCEFECNEVLTVCDLWVNGELHTSQYMKCESGSVGAWWSGDLSICGSSSS